MQPVKGKPAPSRFTSRKIHRWLGIAAAILFLSVSVTGVVLQIEQLFGADEANKEALAVMKSPATLATLQAPNPAALERARKSVMAKFGDQPVASLEWQIKGRAQHFILHLDGPEPTRVDVDASTGVVVGSRPDGEDWLLKLHTGEILGDGGKFLGLGWGLALVAMLVTGIMAYLHMYRARRKGSAKTLRGWRRYFWMLPLILVMPYVRPVPAQANPRTRSAAMPAPPQPEAPASKQGWWFNPDAGFIYQAGDMRLTLWGFAERAVDPDGPDYFRRFRQGAELDLPRITPRLRPAIVYEVDLTNTDFFGDGPGKGGHLSRRNFENLFVSLQDVDDPGHFRLLVGQNTHILSREDNLSSGNLPTISRSLVLEEHGSVNAFGTQLAVQVQKAISPKLTIAASIGDNRGSFNAAEVKAGFGRSVAAKLVATPISDAEAGRKLTLGFAIDRTSDIRDRAFTLATAIGGKALGSVSATGDKLTFEIDAAYTFTLLGRPATIEAESMRSRFSTSRSDVAGGYAMAQYSLFDTADSGDLDVFVRYDVVSLGIDSVAGRANQRALRAGLNYNLPRTNKLANLHLEYAHGVVSGPPAIVADPGSADELRAVFRVSFQRYTRH
ncbi:MAG: PepSY domain-containing protein [Sphingomicrobium sp.]